MLYVFKDVGKWIDDVGVLIFEVCCLVVFELFWIYDWNMIL